ncbi:PLC-like phosphodiesterase, partial [Atractiella rhizophila]
GDSTVEGYVRALQQGCRTVELDCWDGPDEPVVYHGRTMTSKILARDAFTAIDKYAFVASPYPVILSIEVHCNMAQQDKLADIMKECFGEKLVHRSIDEREQDIQVLPSPEELKYRILVKAKNKFISPPKAEEPEQEEVMSDPSSPTSDSSSDSDFKRVVSGFYRRVRKADAANAKLEEKGRRPSVPTSPTSPSAFVAPPISPTNTSKEKGSKPVMSFALAALIVYTVGVKGRGFNKKEYYAPTHVISIGERKLLKIVKETKMDLISHTRNHVVRAYPAGRRFTSSNYVPVNFWSAGMQMVALNWQTFDLGMEINTALFARNGKCGYVLKPEILRVKGKDKAALTTNVKYELDLTLLSAQQLPRITKEKKDDDGPTVSPYVEITVYAPGMTSVPSRKTRVIRGNGFNPCWNENFKIRFEVQAGMLDLTFIRFEVFEAETAASDKTLGRYCICAQSLLPGYRHLPLYDQFGDEYLFSSLFIKSQIKSLSSKVE